MGALTGVPPKRASSSVSRSADTRRCPAVSLDHFKPCGGRTWDCATCRVTDGAASCGEVGFDLVELPPLPPPHAVTISAAAYINPRNFGNWCFGSFISNGLSHLHFCLELCKNVRATNMPLWNAALRCKHCIPDHWIHIPRTRRCALATCTYFRGTHERSLTTGPRNHLRGIFATSRKDRTS